MILIEKVDGGYRVRAAPPNVRETFRTEAPCGREELIEMLRQRGAAAGDIGAAFDIADQEWDLLNGEDE